MDLGSRLNGELTRAVDCLEVAFPYSVNSPRDRPFAEYKTAAAFELSTLTPRQLAQFCCYITRFYSRSLEITSDRFLVEKRDLLKLYRRAERKRLVKKENGTRAMVEGTEEVLQKCHDDIHKLLNAIDVLSYEKEMAMTHSSHRECCKYFLEGNRSHESSINKEDRERIIAGYEIEWQRVDSRITRIAEQIDETISRSQQLQLKIKEHADRWKRFWMGAVSIVAAGAGVAAVPVWYPPRPEPVKDVPAAVAPKPQNDTDLKNSN